MLSKGIFFLPNAAHFSMATCFSGGSYCRPAFSTEGSGFVLDAHDTRHPCIDSLVAFIPNDIHLAHPHRSLALLTGPNMGGKSTYIRQVALLAILAQIGGLVPATRATVPLFDSVMVRVGAGDDVFRGISTFMMEMIECATILRSATPKSLVVIDELGRGTSTRDGLSLAWAIARHLAEIGCLTLFATHFHELTLLADEHPGVHCLHAASHIDTHVRRDIVPLYKIRDGAGDNASHGLHVAELAGFPKAALAMARMLRAHFEPSEGASLDEQWIAGAERIVEEGGGLADVFAGDNAVPEGMRPILQDYLAPTI